MLAFCEFSFGPDIIIIIAQVLAMERVSTLARTWRQKVRASRRRKEKKRVLPEKIEEGEESGEAGGEDPIYRDRVPSSGSSGKQSRAKLDLTPS